MLFRAGNQRLRRMHGEANIFMVRQGASEVFPLPCRVLFLCREYERGTAIPLDDYFSVRTGPSSAD